ncbi:MAG TPA: hypothetical protein VFL80_06040 [Thermoanaerobaculia bacterium]|nr:hypothetical protein [Thermoanaerobaculia bacterium]
MKWLRWFIAGALAVPLCHQVMLAILNAIGWIDRAPFSMAPTKPFGVPQVLSLSFWGGVWGIILGAVLLIARGKTAYWTTVLLFGSIAPTLVAGLVVAPLKGQPVVMDPKMFITGLLVNAAWALGTAAIYHLLSRGQTHG